MSRQRYVMLTRLPTVGCYYVDQDGEDWCTERGPAKPCAICGKSITHGYASSYKTGERRVCGKHVRHVGTAVEMDVARANGSPGQTPAARS